MKIRTDTGALASNGLSDQLGYPTTNEQTTTDGIGRYNHFQKGSIYWSPTTGAHEVFGLIRLDGRLFDGNRVCSGIQSQRLSLRFETESLFFRLVSKGHDRSE